MSQPSTKIWKKHMMARLIQNDPLRTRRVRNTNRSMSTASAMPTRVIAV